MASGGWEIAKFEMLAHEEKAKEDFRWRCFGALMN